MSLNKGLSPNVVQTALDSVFYQEYETPAGPHIATALTPEVFKQSSADKASVISEVFKGVGEWKERAEMANVHMDTPLVGDKITFEVLNYANSVDISKNLFDDDQHDVVQNMMRDFADMARITRDKTAMGIYRNAFSTSLTADGVALFSNSHVNLNGDTIDNLETAALSESSLNTAIVSLAEQKNQSGVIRGHQPAVLLVPSALFKTACEIVESEFRSGTAHNDINAYSSKYNLIVMQSPYLGAAAGGSDSAWYLLARNHSIYRWERQGISTDMVPYQYSRNNSYVYKGEYRETIGAITYEGAVGSNGTT